MDAIRPASVSVLCGKMAISEVVSVDADTSTVGLCVTDDEPYELYCASRRGVGGRDERLGRVFVNVTRNMIDDVRRYACVVVEASREISATRGC
jgi:hypothetical protein